MKNTKKVESTVKQGVPANELKVVGQPEVARGVYSNIALIQHTQNEFVIDFLLKLAGNAQLVSRVILSPKHTAALSKALVLNRKKYETVFGKITEDTEAKRPRNKRG